jgi:hypothetical protein
MAETPAIRASDADRERMVAVLREHATEGRLTLQEFRHRTRRALAVFASNRLEGRLRIGRRVLCLMASATSTSTCAARHSMGM